MKKYISFIIAIMMAIFMFGGCRSTVTPEAPDKTDTANKESAQKDDPVMLSLAHAAPMRPEGAKDLQLKFGLQLFEEAGRIGRRQPFLFSDVYQRRHDDGLLRSGRRNAA